MRTRLPVRFKLALVTAALTFGILCIFAVVIGAVAEQRIRAGFDDDLRASVADIVNGLDAQRSPDGGVQYNNDALKGAATAGADLRLVSTNGEVIYPRGLYPLAQIGYEGLSNFQGLRVASLATLVYARAIRPERPGAPWQVHVADAGHPPALLRSPSGEVRLVDDVTGLLVGVDATAHRETLILEVPAGSTLILYTDGLIERPGRDMDEGISELCARLTAAPADAGPRELCDAAVSGPLDHRDDVALIAVRFG